MKLRLVGLSPAARATLTSIARSLNLQDCVSVEGKVPISGLIDAYQSADIFVSASLSEGFYRPLIEAFACGLPAVIRDSSNLVSAVCQGHLNHLRKSGAGIAFDGTATSLVSSVNAILDDRQRYSDLAVRYSRQFAVEQVIPRYEIVYKGILSRRWA